MKQTQNKGSSKEKRKNVSVEVLFTESGKVTPLVLIWSDGRRFDIDRILDVRKAASTKAGGFGDRYTCRIRGKEIFLFREEDEWFMEVEDR